MADTAALCQQLEAVIAVNTSVAHLAGTVGTTTHLPLPFQPDPRWRDSGQNCDWYDSVVLYRQTRAGDWSAKRISWCWIVVPISGFIPSSGRVI